MEIRSKKVEDWFSMIRQGQITLPRFQRHEAWKYGQVCSLLENMLRDPALPVGVLLTLEVGNDELFHSRHIVGAPKTDGKVTLNLLDGQQRLTALWRSLTDNYDDQTFFVNLANEDEALDDNDEMDVDTITVSSEKRWYKNAVKQPLWPDNANETLKRNKIPVAILCPGSNGESAHQKWKEEILKKGELDHNLIERISTLRQRIAKYDIPFLSLESKTGRQTALDVFINMNTSATPLKDFDIVVAQLESASNQSLHDMVEDLLVEVPEAKNYGRIEDIILSVAALLMEKPPLKQTYLSKEYGDEFSGIWDRLRTGLRRGTEFLAKEGVLNEKCIPNDAAIYLTFALWADVNDHQNDFEGNARALIRRVFWRACSTDRYGKTSANRSYYDYKILKQMLFGKNFEECELFKEKYPLPTIEDLKNASWPSRKDRLPRTILAMSLRAGALDFADGSHINYKNFYSREYHHLFPVKFLSPNRNDDEIHRALNCAYITWSTNRKLYSKAPSIYLNERAQSCSLGEDTVKDRLESHLIPYDILVGDDYDKFLEERAQVMLAYLTKLCEGKG